ncbi:MAG: Dabb family protein [Bauldia sp.]|nr:Dabb family protein [Bauldia sp.]
MAIVDARDLLHHAAASGYRLPAARIAGMEEALEVLEAAERTGCPIALSISEARFALPVDIAMPAIEVAAERASVPVVLRWEEVASQTVLARAIKLGCSALVLPTQQTPAEGLEVLAERCGAIAVRPDAPGFVDLDSSRARPQLEALLTAMAAAWQAPVALQQVRRWRAVEHVVMFNAPDLSDANVQVMFELGAQKLGAIPGVRSVRFGRAARPDSRYGLCWFVRFASAAVVESYKNHPMHVDFADNHFRPFASDRLTSDFLTF